MKDLGNNKVQQQDESWTKKTEETDNSSGYEQTDHLRSSGYLLHEYIDTNEKDYVRIEFVSIYEVISDI